MIYEASEKLGLDANVISFSFFALTVGVLTVTSDSMLEGKMVDGNIVFPLAAAIAQILLFVWCWWGAVGVWQSFSIDVSIVLGGNGVLGGTSPKVTGSSSSISSLAHDRKLGIFLGLARLKTLPPLPSFSPNSPTST